jgi:hypothetical protein
MTEKKIAETIKEERTMMQRIKRVWPALVASTVIVILAIIAFSCIGCSSGDKATTNTSTSGNTLQALQDKNTVQDSRLAILEGKDAKDWSLDISTLKAKVATLESSTTENYSAQISTLTAQISSLQSQLTSLVNVVANMSTGSIASSQLSITVLGSMPVIVSSGDYSFTVRVSNSGTSTVSGNIVLQLTAKSGMVSTVSASISGWQDAAIKPTTASCNSITVVSDPIYLIGGSSTIYQFTLTLSQNGTFEWVPSVTVTQ